MIRHIFATGIRAKLAIVLVLALLAVAAPIVTPAPDAAAKEEVCSYSGSHPTLQKGDTGGAVRHAQCLLNFWHQIYNPPTELWPLLEVDGDFGSQTKLAVEGFQAYYDQGGVYLKDIDGIVGKCTWLALHPYGKDPGPECTNAFPT
jgi:zinc D-Ala-D-Ala carboxypeptidase